MAIDRSAGTEIIRTVHLDDVDSTVACLIFGVQYHIYTVLSIVVMAETIQAAGNYVKLGIDGYGTTTGTSNQRIQIFQQDMNLNETFVWNDKFSFNGHEPVDFDATLSTIAKQDAIADQGSAVVQKLLINTENASDSFHVTCTFIDQNNA